MKRSPFQFQTQRSTHSFRMHADRFCRTTSLSVGWRFASVIGMTAMLCFTGLTNGMAQEHWPQFRGSDSRGISSSQKLPVVWGRETNVAWHVKVPGRGWSSPVVWGNRIFLTSAISQGDEEAPKKGLYFGGERPASTNLHRWLVQCLDRDTGKSIWTTQVASQVPGSSIHVKNSYASETPVTDGERVYALFGQMGLYCLSMDGKVVWSQAITPRKTAYGWGTSASPVVDGDRVYVLHDNEEKSSLAAYDKKTGNVVWSVDREEPTNFATPYVWRHEKRVELVVPGRKWVRSYDLQGQVLWKLKGMSSITIPTPFESDGLLYLCAGYVGDKMNPNKPVYAVRPGAEGDISLPEGEQQGKFIAWMQPNASPYNPSPVLYQQRFYVLWDFGFLSCRDARDGRELYDKQRLKSVGTAGFTSSPWAYRDRVFCLSEDGDTYVVKAGDGYQLERVNSLGEMCMATPAMAADRLFIRTSEGLWCFREP